MSKLQSESALSRGISFNLSMIDQAEKAFLKRSFKRALHLSNQFLQEAEEERNGTVQNTQETISIEIPYRPNDILPWDRIVQDTNSCVLTIDTAKTTRPEPRDRALAVALQSWFEISRNTQENGRQYLVPFCKALTGTPVTFELLLILLRFYVQIGQPGSAIYMATACLQQCRWSPTQLRNGRDDASKKALKEISQILLVELLPFHPFAVHASIEWLNCDYTKGGKPEFKNDLIWKSSPGIVQKNTLETLISSMSPDLVLNNADEPEWFKTSLEACFSKWKKSLSELEKQEEEALQNSIIMKAQKQFSRSTFTLISRHLETQYEHLLQRLKQLLLDVQMVWKKDKGNYKVAGVTAVIGLAVLAFRYHRQRQKLLALLRSAIYEAVVQPTKEILEALQLS